MSKSKSKSSLFFFKDTVSYPRQHHLLRRKMKKLAKKFDNTSPVAVLKVKRLMRTGERTEEKLKVLAGLINNGIYHPRQWVGG